MGMRFLNPLLDIVDSGTPQFDFDPTLSTFTPGMAKRTAPGPFAAAPIIQGNWDGSGTPDKLFVTGGNVISGYFYDIIDAYQGSISLFWTPEKDRDATQTNDEYLFYFYDVVRIWYEHDQQRFATRIGGNTSYYTSLSAIAGTTYHICVSWNNVNTIDGTNYVRLSVNDTHVFTQSSVPSISSTFSGKVIGSSGSSLPANAIIEGLTVYRRVLFDGTYGTDVGNGDEINQIYAAGAGADPTTVTGSWDVTFCMPTNSSTGALSTGTGEAWSHPHSSAALTDTFCETTYGSSAWSTKGTPSTAPADLADADKVFNWGYDWTCDADAEGIEQSLSGLSAGQDYVLRCLAHVNDANDLRIRVTDDTNSADIVTFEFGASSDESAPGVAIFTWELPTVARNGVASDCTAITIAVEGTAASQQVYLHQIEVQENLVDNPSLETGSGDPWIPDGWVNNGLDAGETSQDAVNYHSGASSVQIAGSIGGAEYLRSPTTPASGYVACGMFIYGSGTAYDVFLDSKKIQYSDSVNYVQSANPGASWVHLPYVIRAGSYARYGLRNNSASTINYDDVYHISLDPVSITVTPASEANSTETSGLRVDGIDTLTQPITDLTATSGDIRFKWTPRHGAGDFLAFRYASLDPVIFYMTGPSSNYMYLYTDSNTEIRLIWYDGVSTNYSNKWDASGSIVAGTTYDIKLVYSSSGATLYIDGTPTCTSSTPVNFTGGAPTQIKWGNRDLYQQIDATFAAPD